MIEKTYQPSEIERRVWAAWEEAQAFRAGRAGAGRAKPYCIVIPPPNVTGSLHMGHALNNTLQDILCRFERMRGKRRAVAAGHGPRRHRHADGGRAPADGAPEPTAAIWAAKSSSSGCGSGRRESGGVIVNQLKRLGASCDWSRERFTMDEGLSRAVLKVFVELYKEGLIYKDKRLVNWDPKLLTAISDLEVDSRSRSRAISGTSAIRSTRRSAIRNSSWSPPRGRKRCWATPPSRCIRTTSATSIWSARPRCCRSSAGGSRSSRRLCRSRRRAPARSRSRRRTTSTTSRSAGGTTCALINVLDVGSQARPRRQRRLPGRRAGVAGARRDAGRSTASIASRRARRSSS